MHAADVGSTGEATRARDEGRRRRFVVLLKVLLLVAPFGVAARIARGEVVGSVLSGLTLLAAAGAFISVRRGGSPAVAVTVLITVGVSVATFMGLAAGEFTGSLTWIILAPILAMSVGGARAGWAALVSSSLGIAVAAVGISQGWLPPVAVTVGARSTQALALVGVLAAGFALVLVYERETNATIDTLAARNRELLEAQAAAQRADRARSDFLAVVSHEIRTPLHGVTGMVALLREEKDPHRFKDELRIIEQSADMLLSVINDVLDFSKLESRKLELEQVPVSVATELKAVMELLQVRAAERGNDLELVVEPDVPAWIRSDGTRLRQVVLNLVSNSVKFTADGSVRCRASRSGAQLVLEVSDTGIGISEDVQQRLFSPFVQGDASTTRRFGGTGLGLVISRRLVEAMGGTIELRSRLGEGTTFTVRVPCVPVDAPSRPPEAAPAPTVRRRVLVVEDNTVNQLVASRLLEQLGHEAVVAANGREALELMAAGRFDFVLMDCHMPEMDGFQATEALRARGDQTPVFALTAGGSVDDRARCLAVGMNGMLGKPLRPERLTRLLGTLAA